MSRNSSAPPVSLPLLYSGKVRELYRIDDRHVLIVASDRLSAFDVILPTPIPGKGEILTQMALFWFDRFRKLIVNHLDLAEVDLDTALPDAAERDALARRAMVARRLEPLPIEAIVRGYLAGSGWRDYQRDGRISGITLAAGLRQADRLPEAIFTPSSKAAPGQHDQNLSFTAMADLIGAERAEQVRSISLELYRQAAEYALERGIVIADTKFEFGLDDDRNLVLIDEILTPDSSRFWPLDQYRPGGSPPSFDKQFVRDYLETLDWDKTSPGPALPADVVAQTAAIYRHVWQQLGRR